MKLDPTWHWRAQYSLGRMESWETTDSAPFELLGPGRRAHPGEEEVEGSEGLGDPGRSLLGEDELELGMALEDPGEDEMPERAVGPPGDLEHEHDLFDVLRRPAAGTALPLWWLMGRPATSQARHSGS